VATVRDGRIREHRVYFDQAEFLEQLGLAPSQPPA
jgi:ketosteroid isomerase-like protein